MPLFLRRYISKYSLRLQVVYYARALLGSYVYSNIPVEVACANVVSGILNLVDNTFMPRRIDGTYTLGEEFRKLEKQGRMMRVSGPIPSAILLYRTGTSSVRGAIGHVFILDLDGNTLMSNNSYGKDAGKFTRNYTVESARKRYEYELRFKPEWWVIIK